MNIKDDMTYAQAPLFLICKLSDNCDRSEQIRQHNHQWKYCEEPQRKELSNENDA